MFTIINCRVLGEITRERLAILRLADDIMIQEITAAGVYRDIGQAFVVLLPVKSVGVMGDCRTYEQVRTVAHLSQHVIFEFYQNLIVYNPRRGTCPHSSR